MCFPIWGPDVKVAKIHSNSKRKKEPQASFSMGFRSYVRHFRGAILGCFAGGDFLRFPIWGPDVKVAKIHSSSKRRFPKASFSWVSEAFSGCNFGASPSFRGMGRPPGGDFFHSIWGPDVKVAKIHSSSKREPKASFSMGFRSYVRHFRGAILGLLRPSEAWCFAPGR